MRRNGLMIALMLASGSVLAAGMGGHESGSAYGGDAGAASSDMGMESGTDTGMSAETGVGQDQQTRISSFDTIDVDGDGLVSQEEAAGSPQLVDQWAQFDQNEDGNLDMSEFAQFEEQYEALDQPAGAASPMDEDSGVDMGSDMPQGMDESGDSGSGMER